MKQFIKSLWFLSLCTMLSLSACSKSERVMSKEEFAKSMAETAEQDKKQEPERRHQEMLKKLNVVVYKGAFPASSDDIQIFEIDGVKCIAVYRVGLSCDYNDKHLADKQKRIQAKEKEYQRLLGQPEND